jgi:hypothetical protein
LCRSCFTSDNRERSSKQKKWWDELEEEQKISKLKGKGTTTEIFWRLSGGNYYE